MTMSANTTYKFNNCEYASRRAMLADLITVWGSPCGEPESETADYILEVGADAAADEAIEGWGLGNVIEGSKASHMDSECYTRADLIKAMADFAEEQRNLDRKDGL